MRFNGKAAQTIESKIEAWVSATSPDSKSNFTSCALSEVMAVGVKGFPTDEKGSRLAIKAASSSSLRLNGGWKGRRGDGWKRNAKAKSTNTHKNRRRLPFGVGFFLRQTIYNRILCELRYRSVIHGRQAKHKRWATWIVLINKRDVAEDSFLGVKCQNLCESRFYRQFYVLPPPDSKRVMKIFRRP